MRSERKIVHNALLKIKPFAKSNYFSIAITLAIIFVALKVLWQPLYPFSIVTGDEMWLVESSYSQILSDWFKMYGVYRVISVLLLPMLLKFLDILPFKMHIIAVLAVINTSIFAALAIKCLKLEWIWFPWVLAPCLLAPFWLRGGLCVPCLANELLGGMVASTFLVIAMRRPYGRFSESGLVCVFIFLAVMSYESHIPYAIAFLFCSGRFRASSIIYPIILILAPKVLLSGRGGLFFDPKIQDFETRSVILQDYIGYIIIKIQQLIDFLYVPFQGLYEHAWAVLPVCVCLFALLFCVGSKMKHNGSLRAFLLFVFCLSVPIGQLFLMHNLENGGITWIFLTNTTMGMTLSVLWLGGHKTGIRLILLLAFIWIGTSSTVQIGKLSTHLENGTPNSMEGTILERFATGFVPIK